MNDVIVTGGKMKKRTYVLGARFMIRVCHTCSAEANDVRETKQQETFPAIKQCSSYSPKFSVPSPDSGNIRLLTHLGPLNTPS